MKVVEMYARYPSLIPKKKERKKKDSSKTNDYNTTHLLLPARRRFISIYVNGCSLGSRETFFFFLQRVNVGHSHVLEMLQTHVQPTDMGHAPRLQERSNEQMKEINNVLV